MEATITKTNPLGTERVGKLMMRYAVPSIISIVVNSLYNMVDQVFIGQGCRISWKCGNECNYADLNDYAGSRLYVWGRGGSFYEPAPWEKGTGKGRKRHREYGSDSHWNRNCPADPV